MTADTNLAKETGAMGDEVAKLAIDSAGPNPCPPSSAVERSRKFSHAPGADLPAQAREHTDPTRSAPWVWWLVWSLFLFLLTSGGPVTRPRGE